MFFDLLQRLIINIIIPVDPESFTVYWIYRVLLQYVNDFLFERH